MDIEVKGMTCTGCSSGIERTVGKMDGVASCTVDLAKETARVVFDAAVQTPQRILERIQAMGYEARMLG